MVAIQRHNESSLLWERFNECTVLCINYRWLFDTIRQGYKDGYDEDDIPEAMPDHKSELLTSGLQK